MSILERINQRREEKENQLLKNPLYTKEYKQYYITGTSAFNIPYMGTQCDWHQIDTLKAGREGKFVMHPHVIVGAEDIFGEYGIWDCSKWLEGRGFKKNNYLCATPIRAILDILYYRIVIKKQYPQSLDDFWDFMFDEVDISELHQKLGELELNLSHSEAEILRSWRNKNEL
jgi:hypothetical protein